MLRVVSGLFVEHVVQAILSWCLSSDSLPLCPPHIHLIDSSSEWLQVKLLISTPYWWINSVHRCFCQNALRAWPCRRKFVKLLALTSHQRILVNHNFFEAQRKHIVNSKASIKWQESVRILFYTYGWVSFLVVAADPQLTIIPRSVPEIQAPWHALKLREHVSEAGIKQYQLDKHISVIKAVGNYYYVTFHFKLLTSKWSKVMTEN